MDISIIFVNYKTKDLTINAIESVIEKTEGLEYEIFVVDNNSQDGSIEAIQEKFKGIEIPLNPTQKSKISTLPQGEGIPVYIIKNPINAGFGAANNLAIKQANGKYILCLNTDTLLHNNALKMFFDFMEKEGNQKIGACGAYLIDGDLKPANCGGDLPSVYAIFGKLGLRYIFKNYYTKRFEGKLTKDDKNISKSIGYITGADIFFRKSALDEVGVFDENIFMYFEETDLCKRMKNAGYKVALVEDAKIQHLEGKSSKNLLQKKKWFKKSEFYYFHKHHPYKVFLVKFIYIILYLIDWLILGHKNSKEMVNYIIKL